jgi:hypothetical protein
MKLFFLSKKDILFQTLLIQHTSRIIYETEHAKYAGDDEAGTANARETCTGAGGT